MAEQRHRWDDLARRLERRAAAAEAAVADHRRWVASLSDSITELAASFAADAPGTELVPIDAAWGLRSRAWTVTVTAPALSWSSWIIGIRPNGAWCFLAKGPGGRPHPVELPYGVPEHARHDWIATLRSAFHDTLTTLTAERRRTSRRRSS